MTSPHCCGRYGLVWLIATLVLASCASRPPVREADDSIRELRNEYLRSNPDGRFNHSIERGEVAVGMHFADMLASWGIPDTRERVGDGSRERWTYTLTDRWSRDWVRYDFVFEKAQLAEWKTMRNVASSHPLTETTTAAQDAPGPPESPSGLVKSGDTKR